LLFVIDRGYAMAEEKELEQLKELVSAYDKSNIVQNNDEASTDSQLKNLTLSIEELLHRNAQGTVLDIGCGKGILLEKLSKSDVFQQNNRWNYLAADYETRLEPILQLAAKLRLHRRCEVISLDTLYETWIQSVSISSPLLIVLRNVLHELNIEDTAKLLYLLKKYMSQEDTLFIQDLLVFPKVERGNVCWDSSCLKDVLNQFGFDVVYVEEPSKSGTHWFSSIITSPISKKAFTERDALIVVTEGRRHQLDKWRKSKAVFLKHKDIRANIVAKMDFDLQLSALYQQLDAIQELTSEQKVAKIDANPQLTLQYILSSYDTSVLDRSPFVPPMIWNFRDRANSQDSLEDFLNSKESVAIIEGGTACGKTALVSQVLSRRAKKRSVVQIDCDTIGDVWPMLEQFLTAIKCDYSFEIFSHEKCLLFESIESVIKKLIDSIAQKTIVVFDHFEHLLDPNRKIMDREIQLFISILAEGKAAKVIITTRKSPILDFLPQSVIVNDNQPPVGRFPHGNHIENMLDDYVDRGSIGLESYPHELLEAIDRFPYLAILAGKLIAESGSAVATDPEILKIIKSYLYDELAKRIVTKDSEPALRLACQLRIPTPRILFDNIVGVHSTEAALETGLLFAVSDRYGDDFLSCASILRNNEIESDSVDEDTSTFSLPTGMHEKIAEWYILIYKDTSDPRWLREAQYHTIATGNDIKIDSFGALYKGELFWAAKTWFRRFRNYSNALEALRAAEGMGFRSYEARMLLAACLVRTGRREEGEKLYRQLISEFPHNDGVKTSFVDSLLNIKEFKEALSVLEEFSLSMVGSNPWVAGQYGRIYLGLHDYDNAIKAFQIQIHKYEQAPSIVYVRLAQSYFRLGERDKAVEIISQGLNVYKDDLAINTLFCANLIYKKSPPELEEAEKRLNDLANIAPRNGYILQKLVTVGALRGNTQLAIRRIENIHWKIEPPYLRLPVEITVAIAQKQFSKALEKADSISSENEYGQAIIHKIFLIWANSELYPERKIHIAKKGLERKIPDFCKRNIPILSMRAQLARMANDSLQLEETIALIRQSNPSVAESILTVSGCDSWEDYNPELS